MLQNLVLDRGPNNELVLRWNAPDPPAKVSVYGGGSVENIDWTAPIAQSTGSSVVLPELDPSIRHYFEVVPEDDKGQIIAERHLRFQGISNFRDLGGYETTDGRCVRWGMLYRSGSLVRASKADSAYLSSLRLRSVFDFRTHIETQVKSSEIPAVPDTRIYEVSMISDRIMRMFVSKNRYSSGQEQEIDVEGMMIETFRSYVFDFATNLSKIFRIISDPGNVPALFYCSLGKDRTGFVSAVTLLALGVSAETVIDDFILSEQHINPADIDLLPSTLDPNISQHLLLTRREYLKAGFAAMKEQYGSVDTYLYEGLGLNEKILEKLHTTLLE